MHCDCDCHHDGHQSRILGVKRARVGLVQSLPIRPVGLLVGCALAFLPVRDLRASPAVQGALLGALLVFRSSPRSARFGRLSPSRF